MENNFTEQDSFKLINQMLNKAKNSYIHTGLSAMLWGATISICAFLQFLQFKKLIPVFNHWNVLIGLALIVQIFVFVFERKINQAKYYDEKFLNSVWAVFGFSMSIIWIIAYTFYSNFKLDLNQVTSTSIDDLLKRGIDFGIFNLFNSIILLMYGFPTLVTGWAKSLKSLLVGGIICWISAILVWFTPKEVDMLLIAISVLTSWFIPGLLSNLEYRKLRHNV